MVNGSQQTQFIHELLLIIFLSSGKGEAGPRSARSSHGTVESSGARIPRCGAVAWLPEGGQGRRWEGEAVLGEAPPPPGRRPPRECPSLGSGDFCLQQRRREERIPLTEHWRRTLQGVCC